MQNGSIIIISAPTPFFLNLSPAFFAIYTFGYRPERGFCCPAGFGRFGRFPHEVDQPFNGIPPVSFLRAMSSRQNQKFTSRSHFVTCEPHQAFANWGRQRWIVGYPEAELYCRRYFIHVLAARTRGVSKVDADVVFVESNPVCYAYHRRLCRKTGKSVVVTRIYSCTGKLPFLSQSGIFIQSAYRRK